MYAGHLGVALGARRLCRGVPLWALAVAAVAPDLVSASLGIAGPGDPGGVRTHSLPAGLLITAGAAAAGLAFRPRQAAVAALAVAAGTHIPLDYLTSYLPLGLAGPMVGLGLYRLPLVDFILEGAVVAGGWLLYRRSLPPNARGAPAAWAVLGLLLGVQLVFSALFAAGAVA